MTRVCHRPECANPLDRFGAHVRYCSSACRGEAAHERYAGRGLQKESAHAVCAAGRAIHEEQSHGQPTV